MHASELKKGSYFKHQNTLWRVTRKEVTAVGTHSHTKVKLFARPLRGGGEKSFIFAHEDKVDFLDIIRKTAQVVSITDDAVQIMDTVSFETHDAKCEISDELKEGDSVIFIDVDGTKEILEKTIS